MFGLLLPPVRFLRPNGKTLTDGRSSELKVDRAYRTGTNNLLAMRSAPPKIETETQDSFGSSDGPRATSNVVHAECQQLMAGYYALWILRAIRSRLAEQGCCSLLCFAAVGPKPEAESGARSVSCR
jgi:hypothetical protein